MAVEVSRIEQLRGTANPRPRPFVRRAREPVELVRHGAPEFAELIIRVAKEI
jgi:hypothetical protein